jgi:hypothetical protein
MDRIVPVPERVAREAARRGVALKPDHIPADQVARYDRVPIGTRPANDARERRCD